MGERVIFYCGKNADLMIGAEALSPEKRSPDGKILRPSKTLEFSGGVLITDDKKVVDYIKKTQSFEIGRIREITQAELETLKSIGPTVEAMETAQGNTALAE